MPETNLIVDYAYMRREVGRFLGYSRDPASPAWSADKVTDVDDIIRAGLRNFYYPPPVGRDTFGHRWSFLFEEVTMATTAPFNTGTIGIVDGVVTLTGADPWPAWAAQGDLIVAGSSYTMASRDSNTQLTLNDLTVDLNAGTVFALGRYVYDLPSNYGAILGPFIYEPRNTWPNSLIEITTPANIATRRSPIAYTMRPDIAAIRPKTFDPTVGQRYEVMFAPTPDSAYTLRYRYEINPNMIDATNLYTRGGQQHTDTILQSCLAAAELKLDDMVGLENAKFMERLTASVEFDRQMNAPDSLGYDRGSYIEFTPSDRHGNRATQFTYNNAVI